MVKNRIEFEKQMVEQMILIYCKGHKHAGSAPCNECSELIGYAKNKLDNCKFVQTKQYCNKCNVHCYRPDMKSKIKTAMRYSGPRMLLYHPVVAMKHFFGQ